MAQARAITAILVALLGASGCGDDRIRILDGECEFGEERRLTVIEGPVAHDVALASSGERVWATWSERAGVFARELDPSGAPRGEVLRVGRACDGGLATAAHGDTLLVACGRRGDDAHDDDGGVQLIAVRDGRVSTRGMLGALGPDGEGVALALDEHDVVTVGWQEARGAITQTWMQRAAEGATPERLSSPRARGSRPSMQWSGGRLVVAWGESWESAQGRTEGRVMMRAGARATRAMADVAWGEALPVLRAGAEDDLVLTFRDRRPSGSRPRAQIARVREDALERVEASSHANAIGESLAIGCGEDVFVVAPRTHSRTERLVSVRRYSRELVAQGPEMQIYEHGGAFEHADAQCVSGRLLVLFASRRSREQPRGSVRAVPLRCADE